MVARHCWRSLTVLQRLSAINIPVSSSYDYDTPITTILHIDNIERNYANSYNGRLIISHTWSVEPRHFQCRPRNRWSQATWSIQDNCRSTWSIDSTFDPCLDSTWIWSTVIDFIDFLDVDVVELRVQADASMLGSNNNINSRYIH